MRKRLTYANTMSTLALFFALTGGAMAAGRYLLTTDTIPATSDLAGSTYGNPIIAPGKVTNAKLANPSLSINAGTSLTGGGAVPLGGSTTLAVANGGIGTTQLADGSVTASKLADGSVGTPKLADGSITGAKLNDGAVSTSKLADGSITRDKLATPIDLYSASTGNAQSLDGGPNGTIVQTLSVPAGMYAVTAKAVVGSFSEASDDIGCVLNDDANRGFSDGASAFFAAGGGGATLAMQGALAATSSNVISITCGGSNTSDEAILTSIDATRVDAINNVPAP